MCPLREIVFSDSFIKFLIDKHSDQPRLLFTETW